MPIHVSTAVDDVPLDPAGQETICEITTEIDADRRGELPLHIVFCVDKSGSMAADVSGSLFETLTSGGSGKMDVAKEGVRSAIENLRPTDYFGVVAFSRSAERVTGVTAADGGTDTALRQVSELSCGGGTDIADGVAEAQSLLDRMPDEDAIEWIVLVSDGKDTVDVPSLVADGNASIYAAGIGEDYNQELIQNLSEESGGEWKHISDADALKRFFVDRATEAGQVVAPSATFHLRPRNGATITEVFKRAPQIAEETPTDTFDGYEVGPIDLKAENPPELLVTLDAPPHEQDPNVELLEVELRTDAEVVTDTAVVPYIQTAIDTADDDPSAIRRSLRNVKAGSIAIKEGASEALDYIGDEESETAEAIRDLDDATGDDEARKQKDEISRLPARKTDDS